MSFRTNTPAVEVVVGAYLLEGGKIKATFLPEGGGADLSNYYTKTEADAAFLTSAEGALAYAALEHEHVAADITDLATAINTAVETAVGEIEIPAADTSLAKTVYVATANYTVLGADHIVIVNFAVAGAATITLPATPATGKMIVVKDGKGDANTNTVTISGNGTNIDGAASTTIVNAYEAVTVVYNGTQWNII